MDEKREWKMGATYEVVQLSVGKPQPMKFQNTVIETAFRKKQVKSDVFLSRLNFEGDLQADQKNHGGPDKAVLAYSEDHYTYWNQQLNIRIAPSSFGENITVRGLNEDSVCIGDIFEIDNAVIQVSQPRKPCYKVAASLGLKTLPALLEATGYTGYYFRVLKEGWVTEKPKMKLAERGQGRVSIAEINKVMYTKPLNIEALKSYVELPDLADDLKASFLKKIQKSV